MSKDAKNVPTLRFRGYSDAWEKRKLGELANIRRGASPRPIKNKKWFSQTSQVGWIRISDVTEQNGRIHQVEQYLSDAGQKKTLVLKSKHLLLSIAATVGKPVQNYIQVGVHDGFIVFMDPKFDLDFMFYFLEKYRPNWARFGQPGSQININSELVRDLVVSIPTVHEQVAVAQFIITLDNLIAATQDKIDALEQAKKALLQHLFDQSWRFKGYSDPWEKRKLGSLIEKRGQKNENLDFSSSAVLSAASIKPNPPVKKSSDQYMKTYNIFLKGDLVFEGHTSKQYLFGRFVFNDFRNGIVSHVFDVYRFKVLVDNDFAKRFFHSEHIMQKPLLNSVSNARMLNSLNSRELYKQEIRMPGLSEQKQIGKILKQVDNLIAATQSILSSLELLKKALLQDLFI
ncbi:restriction endonuclease subunit S [Lacticaseibacillus paracasei]|uniref:restriction endonuclease subunit S n=1 Tax=Lacticaseibacillus paracasei TaxID=1597 RepID=UPI0022EC81E1|nr:restriction endonuclease subunit S [Lacticaseibacillus paracasei]WBS98621.1 restriction endonuclease subunit S [Lacticaseibacillus paracasei]